MKRVLIGCACVLLLGVLAGCGAVGGGGGEASKQSGTAQRSTSAVGSVIKTITVKETQYKLTPSKIALSKPGTYVFKADDAGSVTHALEIEGNGVEKRTKDLRPGQGAQLKATLKAGRYEIYCPVDGHRQMGMEGAVTVKGSSGGGGGSGGY